MFSLSGKRKNQIPCFACAVATLILLLILIIREIYWTWAIPEKLSGEVDVVGEVGEGNGESPSTFDTENLVDFVDWNVKMISIVRMTIV